MTYIVIMTPWEHGEELQIKLASHVGVTQTHEASGETAEEMVRDYVETLTDEPFPADETIVFVRAAGRA